MKQYYEDGKFIVPFRKVMCVTYDKDTVHIHVTEENPFTITTLVDSARFIEEYRAWLDGTDENARG
jgi:hypothetical protein